MLIEDERNELKSLRKENKELRMEQDIFKKASAFFTKKMRQSSDLLEKSRTLPRDFGVSSNASQHLGPLRLT